MRHIDLTRVVLTAILSVCCLSASAKCGGVDYSWGADGLAKAHDFVITMLLYVVYICYAVAGIVSVIASLQIYFKINAGAAGGAIVGFIIGYCVLGFLAGLVVLVVAVGTGAGLIMVKQRKGLHTKKTDKGIFVYTCSKKI